MARFEEQEGGQRHAGVGDVELSPAPELVDLHLRRARRRVKVRPHLRRALDTFDRLGAEPWAEMARAELAAAMGQPGPRTGGAVTAPDRVVAARHLVGRSPRWRDDYGRSTSSHVTTTSFDRAVELLRRAEAPALACHAHPDGDALGSLLAMHLLCEANGKVPVSSFPSPFHVAPHYRFLPGLDRLTPTERFPAAPDLLITFDTGTLDRMGDLRAAACSAREVVVLDHHPDNQRFGTVNVVQTDAAATAVVVRQMAAALGWELGRDVATNLYVGLLTDTGRFQYPNTTPEVFLQAEELAEYGLPLAELTRELYEKHRFAYLRLAGIALARAELDEEHHLVAAWLTAEELEHAGVSFDETEGFIDLLRRTAEAEVVVALKEAPGEGLRVSLRSLGGIDVGAVAAELGGGGHPFMAGFTSRRSIPDTLRDVRTAIAAGRAVPS